MFTQFRLSVVCFAWDELVFVHLLCLVDSNAGDFVLSHHDKDLSLWKIMYVVTTKWRLWGKLKAHY